MPPYEKRSLLHKRFRQDCHFGFKEAATLSGGFNLGEQTPPQVRNLVRELLNLNHVIEDAHAILQSTLTNKDVVAYDLAPDLPLVPGDHRQIRRLLVALMRDAAEARAPGASMMLLRTELIHADRRYLAANFPGEDMPEGKYAWLQISDIACAVQEEDHVRNFEPHLGTKYTGQGFDLVAVLAIVRAHEGGIAVTSKPRSSTIIKVLLPCEDAKIPDPQGRIPIEQRIVRGDDARPTPRFDRKAMNLARRSRQLKGLHIHASSNTTRGL